MRTIFEKLLSDYKAIQRHETAPLSREREQFLRYLEECGTGRGNIITTACYLLQIIRLLRLSRMRDVTPDEIERAASRWSKRTQIYHQSRPGPWGERRIAWEMRRWMRFAGKLRLPRPKQPFRRLYWDYVTAMRAERGLSDATVKTRGYRASAFLKWYARKHQSFGTVSISNVDGFLFRPGASGHPVTIAHDARALRDFFRHAEARQWCRPGIAVAIKTPLLRYDPHEVRSPEWDEVVRLLRGTRSSSRSDIRAHALLHLFAIYGLRASEAIRVRLEDIDWSNKTIVVRRGKRGGLQQFPLHAVVGRAIRRYIEEARPQCSCPNLFVTLNGPYRPLIQPTVSAVVHSRMLQLGIRCMYKGPQSLRHACATRMLNLGVSYTEIADFLGHRNNKTVHHYAKLNPASLTEISKLDLIRDL
jgi:integrase/recombinase XerD